MRARCAREHGCVRVPGCARRAIPGREGFQHRRVAPGGGGVRRRRAIPGAGFRLRLAGRGEAWRRWGRDDLCVRGGMQPRCLWWSGRAAWHYARCAGRERRAGVRLDALRGRAPPPAPVREGRPRFGVAGDRRRGVPIGAWASQRPYQSRGVPGPVDGYPLHRVVPVARRRTSLPTSACLRTMVSHRRRVSRQFRRASYERYVSPGIGGYLAVRVGHNGTERLGGAWQHGNTPAAAVRGKGRHACTHHPSPFWRGKHR